MNANLRSASRPAKDPPFWLWEQLYKGIEGILGIYIGITEKNYHSGLGFRVYGSLMRGLCGELIGTISLFSYLQTYISILIGLYYILAVIMSILY